MAAQLKKGAEVFGASHPSGAERTIEITKGWLAHNGFSETSSPLVYSDQARNLPDVRVVWPNGEDPFSHVFIE